MEWPTHLPLVRGGGVSIFLSIDAGVQVAIFFTRMWTRCGRCKMLGQVVPWVKLLVQRRLCPIFVKS